MAKAAPLETFPDGRHCGEGIRHGQRLTFIKQRKGGQAVQTASGAFFVTRAKRSMNARIRPLPTDPRAQCDQTIALRDFYTSKR